MTADNLDSRMARMQAAISCEKGDRVPVWLFMDYKFPCRYKGFTQGDYFRNQSLGDQAYKEVFDELGGWDITPGGSMTTQARDILEAPMVIKVPGKHIPEDDVIQWEEKEVIKQEDYDKIIEMGWKRFMYDFYPQFREWDVADYHTRIEKRAEGEVKAMKAGRKYWEEKGVPVFGGSQPFSPLMMLSCSRSMIKFTLDIYRIPDKVEAAMDAMVSDLIEVAIEDTKTKEIDHSTGIPTSMIVLERGGSGYFPVKVFERFELPYLNRMVEAFVAEGITPIMHFDQDWVLNLPHLKELPKGKCIAQFDSTTDIFKAKEILRDHICIMGDVPASLLVLGKPQEVEDYCKKLIDVVGEGGGFILGVGCSVPVDAKFENLKTMVDTAKNYNPHSS